MKKKALTNKEKTKLYQSLVDHRNAAEVARDRKKFLKEMLEDFEKYRAMGYFGNLDHDEVEDLIMSGNEEYKHSVHYLIFSSKVFGGILLSCNMSEKINDERENGWYD